MNKELADKIKNIKNLIDLVIDSEQSAYENYYCPDEGFDPDKLEGEHLYLDAMQAWKDLLDIKLFIKYQTEQSK